MTEYYVILKHSYTDSVVSVGEYATLQEAERAARDHNIANQDATWNCVDAHVIEVTY